jgi:hypothetical protein
LSNDPVHPTVTRREAPWMAGLRAARANLVPGLMVQAAMLTILLAYFFYPPMRDWLDRLAEVKARWGYGYSAVAAIMAGAVIPEIMRIVVFQQRKVRQKNFANLVFTVPFWCGMGLVVDLFYRQQALWFGAEATFSVVWKKVLVDQFIYNPLFAAPVTAWLYDWKNNGYRIAQTPRFFTVAYYRETVVATLIATWGVWIPIVSILYSLPSLLQIPLFALALSLWVMLYTWMSEARVETR